MAFLLFQVVENEKPSIRIVSDEATGNKLAYITYDHPDYASYAIEVFNGIYFGFYKSFNYCMLEVSVLISHVTFLTLIIEEI